MFLSVSLSNLTMEADGVYLAVVEVFDDAGFSALKLSTEPFAVDSTPPTFDGPVLDIIGVWSDSDVDFVKVGILCPLRLYCCRRTYVALHTT